jgi:fructose/tagatose bisphosphate aldolase
MIGNKEELLKKLQGAIQLDSSFSPVKIAKQTIRDGLIDALIESYVFSENQVLKETLYHLIGTIAHGFDTYPASIQELYEARGRGEFSGFTIPAINLRGMTYDMARAAFRAALGLNTKALIFEIAKSEIGYTSQRPTEYRTVLLAAAIKEGYQGPVFIQGDHFQINAKNFTKDRQKEIEGLKALVKEAIEAEFFNIDIDASTVVDLSQPTHIEQQRNNYETEAGLIAHIRNLEPRGITVSVGGEIGEVGKINSTPEDLIAFMDGLIGQLKEKGDLKGISKISVQTGTSHGGVVLPDGTIAKVKLDFDVLERLSKLARERYGLAGAVQHGASTLPDEAFDEFPKRDTAEIHLATGFQNLLLDHPKLPLDFKHELMSYMDKHFVDEKNPEETQEQFYYKTRKKAFGPFKRAFWNLPQDFKQAFGKDLEGRFSFLFEKLGIKDKAKIVERTITPIKPERGLSQTIREIFKPLL